MVDMPVSATFFESRRGEALSVLSRGRPRSGLRSDEIWDWAGVNGTWYGVSTFTCYNRRRENAFSDTRLPEELSLSVVAGRTEVEQAYSARFMGKNRETLWSDFGDLDDLLNANSSHPLQPLFFHGTCPAVTLRLLNANANLKRLRRRGESSRREALSESSSDSAADESRPIRRWDVKGMTAFAYDVTYVADHSESDNPPQVRYTIAITFADPRKRIILRGVQPWGPCSGAGVYGVRTTQCGPSEAACLVPLKTR
jgi:hypothetical protein